MSLPKHNHILKTPIKKKTQKDLKSLGQIMKFQNLKLEKEREREREREESKKQKRQSI